VRLIEIVGYLVVIVAALALLYSCLVHVELKVQVHGTLRPFPIEIACGTKGVLVSYSISSGAVVDVGDEICRVVTDPSYIARAQAHVELNDVIDVLSTAPEQELIRAREVLEKMRDEVLYAPTTETLRAPAAGRVQLSDAVSPGTIFEPDVSLANILRLDRLVMEGTILPNQAEKIEVGQAARVRLDVGRGVMLEGQVAWCPEEGNSVSIEFAEVPSRLVHDLERLPDYPTSIPFRNAEVVVGRKSLFLYLFARKQ
jgi:hypothetical protein